MVEEESYQLKVKVCQLALKVEEVESHRIFFGVESKVYRVME